MRYIRAKKIKFGGVTFDSEFEFKVFNILKDNFELKTIDAHFPVCVRPQTQWFKAQNWRVDFRIKLPKVLNNSEYLYVEAKGIIQQEFKEKMKNLSYFRPDIFENLVIVSPVNQCIVQGFNTVKIHDLSSFLYPERLEDFVNHCKKRIT
ncbi:MAG: hypothetical protein WBA13_18190 [Microcoleaceae cyanobacterium]